MFIESNISRACKKAIQSHIDSQILKYGGKILQLILCTTETELWNRTSNSDEIVPNRSQLYALIDLKQGEKAIKASLRKSYSSLINWGKRRWISNYIQEKI